MSILLSGAIRLRALSPLILALIFSFSLPVSPLEAGQAPERVRTEIPYRDGTVVLLSEFQEKITETRYRAKGQVEISFQDVVITSDEVEYDELTRVGETKGAARFSQNKQWLVCSRAEFNFESQTGVFYDASGFTDEEFLIRGRTIRRTGRDTYVIDEGYITACADKLPKWSFDMSRAKIRVDRTARLHHMVFKVKGIPLFYTPYLIVPMERKRRNSGFLIPHTGTSTSKGRVFSEGYFQTLGPSADITVYGDYFTERGLGYGGIFRARPNPETRLYLLAYGIGDRLGQGGAHLIVDGETSLRNGFRAVANVNITSNFRFRQAFSDSFHSATIPLERSVVFVTGNQKSFSTNFAFHREEVLQPERSVVIRKAPTVEFLSLGQPLGRTPLIFYLRLAAEGIRRTDSVLQTPSLVQRLDLFPRLALRLPALRGFSLIPSIGFRQTYYSARIDDQPQPQVIASSLYRHYSDFELDMRAPTLEKTYRTASLGTFKHVIEPVSTYRWINGIDHLRETIRFDEHDAVADSNELEYGVVNRIFKSREVRPGVRQDFEFLSLRLSQKYYFDPDFGGAFQSGSANIFYPLDTLTGFSLTGTQRNLAPTSMVLRISPSSAISHDIRADYDSKFKRFRDASISTAWYREKFVLAATYFRTYALEPETFDAHHIQALTGYGSPLRGLSASVVLSYNIQTSKLLNSYSRLNYAWDCCAVAMEFQQFDLGARAETRFSFSFTLKGIGSFGNIKRPESLF